MASSLLKRSHVMNFVKWKINKNLPLQFLVAITSVFRAQGAMVLWLERSLVKQEDLGSIPA